MSNHVVLLVEEIMIKNNAELLRTHEKLRRTQKNHMFTCGTLFPDLPSHILT